MPPDDSEANPVRSSLLVGLFSTKVFIWMSTDATSDTPPDLDANTSTTLLRSGSSAIQRASDAAYGLNGESKRPDAAFMKWFVYPRSVTDVPLATVISPQGA